MTNKSKALSSSDAPKVCIEVILIIKGWCHSRLHWKLGLQFISKTKMGGELAGKVMNLTLQQRSWQGISQTGIYGAVLQHKTESNKPVQDIFKSNHLFIKYTHTHMKIA